MRNMEVGLNIDISHPGGTPSISILTDWSVEWVRLSHKRNVPISVYTEYIDNLRRVGIKTLLILGYETLPGFPNMNDDWNDYISRLTTLCRDTAAVIEADVYQIWNEPDLIQPSPGYDPRVKPQVYARMVNEVGRAIREVTQGGIIGAGLASGNPNWWKQVKPLDNILDAIAVHPYGQRPQRDWPHPDWGFGNLSDLMKGYKDLGYEVWVTEIGTNDLGIQARFPIHAFWTLDESAPITFWFCYSDEMVNPFGLVNKEGPKPSLEWFLDYLSYPLHDDEPESEYQRGRRETIEEIIALLSQMSA